MTDETVERHADQAADQTERERKCETDTLMRGEILLSREPHCCTNVDGKLRVSIDDGGGGPFMVINATEWAFDSPEDAARLLRQIWNRLVPPLNI